MLLGVTNHTWDEHVTQDTPTWRWLLDYFECFLAQIVGTQSSMCSFQLLQVGRALHVSTNGLAILIT